MGRRFTSQCDVLLVSSLIGCGPIGETSLLCALAGDTTKSRVVANYSPTSTQLEAIIHYATSEVVPQQSLGEITVTFEALKSRAPCNFLVFVLGHDCAVRAWCVLWSINDSPPVIEATGLILRLCFGFPGLTCSVFGDSLSAPVIKAPACVFGDSLSTPVIKATACSSSSAALLLQRCLFPFTTTHSFHFPLVPRLSGLHKTNGETHVFLHDGDQTVEKMYAEEFLCSKSLVKGVENLKTTLRYLKAFHLS
ncbi:glucuronoxylan 4-O-methyltransferase 3-like [Alnus glutinosa]|uniref:glucuronoxylan 4-O-methyltransferase 3-like n=1 Tax=Alnus glutinosa TaxID=3517 RepID=UPI002D7752BD|nr:glucuronoxylan 4-O-methyltransferase 3-like [Alnus glutinosa]